jgi:hypothetical protein
MQDLMKVFVQACPSANHMSSALVDRRSTEERFGGRDILMPMRSSFENELRKHKRKLLNAPWHETGRAI